jgi:hypothetical protein
MMTKLNDIPPKNPFKVPDNYFDEVNKKILSSVAEVEPEVRKISIYNRFRTSILIAASVTGFIIISYSAFRLFYSDRSNSPVSEVLHELNPDSLINDIDISSLEESASSLIGSQESLDVSKKDIIDYLLLENVEINDIYERL